MHGLLVIDKPAGITSRDAVNRIQGMLPRGTRIGHTGTLDPLATGVLVVCIGNATRLAEYVQRMPKTYRAGIVLGARSDTDDADGTITPTPNAIPPTEAELAAALASFVGTIDQVPPAYSAAKVTGRRAYALARRGAEVNLSPRAVTVHAIERLRYEYPHLEIEVRCSKGTYIRSLARDLGKRLGCGGYIATLRRTHVGTFDAASALPVDADAAAVRAALLPLARAVADLAGRVLTEDEAARIRQGKALPLTGHDLSDELALFDARHDLVGIATVDQSNGVIRPAKVFPP